MGVSTSVLEIYQSTCLILKQKPVTSLAENSVARLTLDTLYPQVFAYMLEAGEWHFAAKSIGLSADTTDQPAFGYNFFFTKPADYVRLIKISNSPYLWPTLDSYSEEAGQWAADCNPLYLMYVSNDNTHGANLGAWTPHFERAFHYELANRAAPRLTNMSDGDLERLEKKTKWSMQEAKSKDAINLPAERPPFGLLVQSRIWRRTGGPWWPGPGGFPD